MKYCTPIQILDVLLHILSGILRSRDKMDQDSTLPMDIQQLVNLCIEGPFNSAEASIYRCQQAMNSLETDRRLLAEKIQIQDHAIAQISSQIKAQRASHMAGFANRLDISLYEQLLEASHALKQLELRSTEYGMALDTIRHFLGLLMAQKKWSALVDGPYMFEVPIVDVRQGQIEELPAEEEEEVQENASGEEEADRPGPNERKRKLGVITSGQVSERNDSMDVEMVDDQEPPPSKRVCLREEAAITSVF